MTEWLNWTELKWRSSPPDCYRCKHLSGVAILHISGELPGTLTLLLFCPWTTIVFKTGHLKPSCRKCLNKVGLYHPTFKAAASIIVFRGVLQSTLNLLQLLSFVTLNHKCLPYCQDSLNLILREGWATPCGICDLSSLTQGSNPCPLHWENGVLTTGTPGKSLLGHFRNEFWIANSKNGTSSLRIYTLQPRVSEHSINIILQRQNKG